MQGNLDKWLILVNVRYDISIDYYAYLIIVCMPAVIEAYNNDLENVRAAGIALEITGEHDIFILFSHKNIELKEWKFVAENDF